MSLPIKPREVLKELAVRAALAKAWVESNPGLAGGHEEGGFVVFDKSNNLSVIRWPKGETSLIRVPDHAGSEWNGLPIVATFHTHPNTGPDFMQEPSETDKRGVKDDVDLKGAHYVGEFVIANEMVYLITPGGAVREVDTRADLLG
jgi:hypothetical protein